MEIKNIVFEKSAPSLKECPENGKAEFAFIGRSNVGKSSLINMLANNRKLAYTSGSPGKTRLANFFLVDNTWRIVDLPGYGYARVGKEQRVEFKQLIFDYIGKRDSLCYVFVLLDSRIPPQEIDLNFINWLGVNNIPFILIGTKCEKMGTGAIKKFQEDYFEKLKDLWEEMPYIIFTSATKKLGRTEILDFIGESLNKA